MPMSNGELNLFLLKADGLVRCRWDGNSERVDVLNRALNGETVRELAPDPFQRNRLYVATLTEIHISEDGGESWKWLPSGGLDYRDMPLVRELTRNAAASGNRFSALVLGVVRSRPFQMNTRSAPPATTTAIAGAAPRTGAN